MGANLLKAFVRIDASKRVVPASLVLRKSKPKNGNWFEIDANTCCGAGGTVVANIASLALLTDATVTINVGCGALFTSGVLITTTGADENARRTNLVTQLNTLFGNFGSFTLVANNSITFVSASSCLNPVFVVIP
jgi:hypothetical protein